MNWLTCSAARAAVRLAYVGDSCYALRRLVGQDLPTLQTVALDSDGVFISNKILISAVSSVTLYLPAIQGGLCQQPSLACTTVHEAGAHSFFDSQPAVVAPIPRQLRANLVSSCGRPNAEVAFAALCGAASGLSSAVVAGCHQRLGDRHLPDNMQTHCTQS